MEQSEHIRELYQELIIDHGTRPKNCFALHNATQSSEGHNPLCGDRIKFYLVMQENQIQQVSFQGEGCAISIASASLLTELLQGKTQEEALHLFENFQSLVKNEHQMPLEALGKLNALAGVRAFPARVKCATLAWHTFKNALLNEENKTISTE